MKHISIDFIRLRDDLGIELPTNGTEQQNILINQLIKLYMKRMNSILTVNPLKSSAMLLLKLIGLHRY